MHLKEAFRYQNYLNELISATTSYLSGGKYTTKTSVLISLRSR